MKQRQKPLSFSLHPDNHAYIEAVVLKQKETNHRYNRSMYMDDLITHLRTKAKPKAKTELVEIIYPANLNVAAWDKWIAFRKKAKFKAYKSDATMKKLSESLQDELKYPIDIISLKTGSLDKPGSETGGYISYIKYNTEQIIRGLKD